MSSSANALTETDKTYAELHAAIVRGELLPNQRLIELDLAKQLGVGRAAVRTAIDRLAQDGLVERHPNRGARVRRISLEEAVEMYEARAVLEGLGARYAAKNATEKEISELRTLVKQMEQRLENGDLLELSNLNAELHDTLLRIANHQIVTRLLRQLRASHVHFQYRMILVPRRATLSLQEHRAIVDAVATHDADAAENAMILHLGNSALALRQSSQLSKEWSGAS
jgi:DNA-binding GntR family transcriptional regulator